MFASEQGRRARSRISMKSAAKSVPATKPVTPGKQPARRKPRLRLVPKAAELPLDRGGLPPKIARYLAAAELPSPCLVVDVDIVAHNFEELARSLPQARDKRVILTRPEAAVELSTDSALVGQVLLNLLTNALEATPAGTGRVQFSVRAEPGRVCFEVKDNGRGLDEAELTKVFEPFYTSKRGAAAGGSGLGLSISHAIVESLGGMLTAASQGPGCGSTFTLLLPADRTDAPTPNA